MGAAGLHLTQDSATPFVLFIIWHFLQNCIFFFRSLLFTRTMG